jgi:hypothetical protein
VSVVLEQDAVGETAEVDVSALRLLVGHEPEPVVEILVTDEPMSRLLVERVLLPALSPASLACCAVRYQAAEPAEELAEDILGDEEEEFDGDDDNDEGWR